MNKNIVHVYFYPHECMVAVNISIVVVDKKIQIPWRINVYWENIAGLYMQLGGEGGGLLAVHYKRLVNKLLA